MEHGKDNLCVASNMDMHGHPAVGANLQSPSEGEYGTDPGSWYQAVADTAAALSRNTERAEWDPYQDQSHPVPAEGDQKPRGKTLLRATKPARMDLLTIKAMSTQILAEHLEARGCT